VKNCIFCDKRNPKIHTIIAENEHFYARWDNYPVSKGHAEIIPKKHIKSFFDLDPKKILLMHELIQTVKTIIDIAHHPDAYNIGVNDGEAAGRTVHHLHVHLIPRYRGDVPNPRGGVRHIIPGKGNY